jgi:hypothetical protein
MMMSDELEVLLEDARNAAQLVWEVLDNCEAQDENNDYPMFTRTRLALVAQAGDLCVVLEKITALVTAATKKGRR